MLTLLANTTDLCHSGALTMTATMCRAVGRVRLTEFALPPKQFGQYEKMLNQMRGLSETLRKLT